MTSTEKNEERRRFPRQNVDYAVAIVASDGNDTVSSVPGHALNISKEGLCLETTFDAPVASLISVSIEYREHDSLLLAEVMWRQSQGDRICYGLKIKNWSYLDPSLEQAWSKPFGEKRFENLPHRIGNALLAFHGGMNPVRLV